MSAGGWYTDPEGGPGLVRWWDGSGWSEHTAAVGSPETAGPPQPPAPPNLWQRLRTKADDVPADTGDWRRRPGGPAWHQSPERRQSPEQQQRAAWREGAVATAAETDPQTDTVPRRPWYQHPAVPVVVALVLLAGLIAGVSALHDSPGTDAGPAPSPSGTPPPLADLCSDTAPSRADPNAPRQPAPSGPRITDPTAKISYARQGAPFLPWDQGTWGSQSGSLGEEFTTGQYFITQQVTPSGGSYMTTILSGTVPATYGDDPHPNIQCAARVIAEDVRKSYYPQPNQRTGDTARPMTISGRPAYYMEFHLAFDVPGYDAKGEQVAICVVDVPGSKAAALYVSIPDTHKQYRSLLPTLMGSIRVTS